MTGKIFAPLFFLLTPLFFGQADVLMKYSFSKSYDWDARVPIPDEQAPYVSITRFQASGSLYNYGVNAVAGNYFLSAGVASELPLAGPYSYAGNQSAFFFLAGPDGSLAGYGEENVGNLAISSIAFKISGPKGSGWALVSAPFGRAPTLIQTGRFEKAYPEFDSVVIATSLVTDSPFYIIVYVPRGQYVNVDDFQMNGSFVPEPITEVTVAGRRFRTSETRIRLEGRAPANAKVFIHSDDWSKDKPVRVRGNAWSLTVRLKPGLNKFRVYTKTKGKPSKPIKVTVERK